MDKEIEVALKNLIGIDGLERLNAVTRLATYYERKPDFLASRLIMKGIEEIEANIDAYLKVNEL